MLRGTSKKQRRARYSGSSLRRVDRLASRQAVNTTNFTHVDGLQITARKTSIHLKMRVCNGQKRGNQYDIIVINRFKETQHVPNYGTIAIGVWYFHILEMPCLRNFARGVLHASGGCCCTSTCEPMPQLRQESCHHTNV